MILLTGVCIAFGAVIASVLIINRMNQQYSRKTFTDLENISRLITAEIDPSVLTALASPSDYDSAEYLAFKEFLTARFSRLQFEGERIYLLILMRHDTNLNVMCDLESSIGTYYPLDVYTDGPYKDAYESGEYVHVSGEVTSEGSWLFVCGPIFDREGRVIALIETGYNMRSVLEQTRMIVIQTSLIVIVAAVAFLLIIIEFIIIFSAYTKNKLEMAAGPLQMAESPGEHPFHPELLRALVFFLFMVNNLEAALLPMYAVNLYKPLFNLPKEFVVTLPIMADLMSAALALLIVPVLLELAGLKRISILAVIFIFIGNMLCFIADNTIYLTVAHVFTGFSGGALLLVINTIIGAQRDIKNVNSGFAHFNASYLAGVNVGVVLGSILAQFFAYRTVYLFSTILALMLAGVTIFSIRSKTVNYIYNVQVRREKSKGRMAKFLFNPVVIATLFFLVMPYAVSLSFTSYFMPIYSIENGLTESNIGQLILLNGLFAILFGTSLCGYVSTKAPIKVIIALSLFVNAGAIYLFSLNMSIAMLIVVMVILAMVNVFALTNIQTYYAVLYQNTKISSSKALGIYSAVENMSMAAGPVVFSYLASGSTGLGLKFVSGILVASLLLFILVSGALGGKKLSAAAGTGETSGTGETGGDTDPTGETSA
jgi:predicted MFS family arabinose efflux permease